MVFNYTLISGQFHWVPYSIARKVSTFLPPDVTVQPKCHNIIIAPFSTYFVLAFVDDAVSPVSCRIWMVHLWEHRILSWSYPHGKIGWDGFAPRLVTSPKREAEVAGDATLEQYFR